MSFIVNSRGRDIVLATAAACCLPALAVAGPADTAEYTLNFEAAWSSQTHPTDFPGNSAHFSGLVGGTHNADVQFWATGELASAGIERVAETGSKTSLINEVENAIDDGDAEFVLSGGAVNISPGSVSMSFNASQEFDLVTVVTMIAPSPDWFVGVAGADLFVDNAWVDQLVVQLYPYDAGTDSGPTFTSSNQPTNPPENIFRIEQAPFLNNGAVLPLGTFTFTRVPDLAEDTDDDAVPDVADNCLLQPNADQRDSNNDGFGNACDADLNNDCQTDFADLSIMKAAFFGTSADEDLDGDGNVNFADLAIAKALFFSAPGPSDAPNDCAGN